VSALSSTILVVAEQRGGRLNRVSWETIAAAQSVGDEVELVLPGADVRAAAAELAAARVTGVTALQHAALDPYTADGYVQALAAFITERAPALVLLPHTYQTRDFAPALAARLGRALVTDCTGVRRQGERLVFSRPMFQGKLAADVAVGGAAPHFASMQIGAFRADAAAQGAAPTTVRQVDAAVDTASIRQKPDPPFQEARQAVDLAQAERIVAVGRGIKGQEHLALVERLAAACGAELAASRPICDSGWVPMERQIGSSGQTVAPKLYIAAGISGAIQHVVGMKGARTIVAINKDPDAPIFEIADYGIVGDLFEVIPAMIGALNEP
jgi:electron transfer flavoprotein alpha subunit